VSQALAAASIAEPNRENRDKQVRVRPSYAERAERLAMAEGVAVGLILERGLDLLIEHSRHREATARN
jgi:hypothetical protein